MTRFVRHLLLMPLLLSLIFAAAACSSAEPTVSKDRLERLTKGMNIAWFRGAFEPQGDESLKLMRQAGIRHVRLSVGAKNLFDENAPEALHRENLARLDGLINRLRAHGLTVIVEIHDGDERIWTDDAYLSKFARFWKTLARHLSSQPAEMVFLEALNEPSAPTAERWNAVYPTILRAMREGAPNHTLIASANQRVTENDWDQIRALEALKPLPDVKNVVYNFHFYSPMQFTHQGATWGWDATRTMKALPYPSTPENVKEAAEKADPGAKQFVEAYGSDRWNAGKIDGLMKRAADWAKRHDVPLTMNEFGVYRAVSLPDDRNRYLRDVRIAAEKHGIGWTMWEWNGGFGLADAQDGRMTVNAATAAALGLKAGSATLPPPRKAPANMEKAGWKLTFGDEFTGGKLDTSKWIDSYPDNVRTHSNNEQQWYATDGYEVKDGKLRLIALRRPMGGMPYTSGMVASFGKFAQQFGWFEIRAKFPKGKGMWPAFWLLPNTKAWPPEIDILEILGHETNKVYMTNHWTMPTEKHGQKGGSFTGPDLSEDFHTFAVEWKPDEIVWYVDGVERFRSDANVPKEPMYLLANLAVGGDWPGMPDETTPFPGVMEVDYIRVYQRK